MVSNGSLMGTDEYARKLRLSARPSQNFETEEKEETFSETIEYTATVKGEGDNKEVIIKETVYNG